MDENVYYGISGLTLPVPKKHFPPEHQDKSRLEYYATIFNSLEVNSSFYKLPQISTVAKWTATVPEDFRFTFKLSKEITHTKQLAFDEKAVKAFMERISPAATKKGCILVQFPPSLKIASLNELQNLLSEIKFHDQQEWNIAVEFRDKSWYEREVAEILAEYKACMVLQDLPASATPPEFASGEIIYLRFHGPAGGYRGSYENDILESYAQRIKEWHIQHKQVYCYFNNTMGNAVENLKTLMSFTGS